MSIEEIPEDVGLDRFVKTAMQYYDTKYGAPQHGLRDKAMSQWLDLPNYKDKMKVLEFMQKQIQAHQARQPKITKYFKPLKQKNPEEDDELITKEYGCKTIEKPKSPYQKFYEDTYWKYKLEYEYGELQMGVDHQNQIVIIKLKINRYKIKMFKGHRHQNSEQINKYSSASNIKKMDDSDFNINKFREGLYSKIKSFNNADTENILKESTNFYVKSSTTKPQRIEQRQKQQEMRGRYHFSKYVSIPSFDDILKHMTTTKLKEKDNSVQLSFHHKKNPTDTSRKLSGIQTKIEALGQHDQSIPQRYSQRFSSQIKLASETPKMRPSYQSGYIDKPIIAKSIKNGLLDKLPLKELMDIRSKIEGSSQNDIQGLTVNYVSELVKLAQVIAKQVKKSKY